MGFEWIDYRGLALNDRSGEQDVQELSQYLIASECVFLTISGEYLQYSVVPTTVRDVKSDRMNQFLQQYISRNHQPTAEKPFPIVIIITKYDLCKHRDKEEVIEDVKKLFQALFTPDSGWLVMICPVSLGKELESDVENGVIIPVNVHLPIVFAVYAQLRTHGLFLKTKRDRLKDNLQQINQQNRLKKFLAKSEQENQSSELELIKNQLEIVKENMGLLAQELQQVSLFLGDKEVTADV